MLDLMLDGGLFAGLAIYFYFAFKRNVFAMSVVALICAAITLANQSWFTALEWVAIWMICLASLIHQSGRTSGR